MKNETVTGMLLILFKINASNKQNIAPHMMRHSVAIYLTENGMDASCVLEILGHSSIKTTRIYSFDCENFSSNTSQVTY